MYDLILPISAKDFEVAKENFSFIQRNLNVENIIVIGPESIAHSFDFVSPFSFICEDELLDGLSFNTIKKLLSQKGEYQSCTGWYFQQFLKMAYSYCCKKDAYIVWDSDTIPVKPIQLINAEEKYMLNLKKEYHENYFITIKSLLGLEKNIKYSYISEHMIFDTQIMHSMLDAIEKNKEIPGNNFYEKIINGIDCNMLGHGGFSEFETYGTFATTYFPEKFVLRKLKTLRGGRHFFGEAMLNSSLLDWLGKYYDTVSYEKSHKPYWFTKFHLWTYCKAFSPSVYIFFSKIVAKIFK